MDNWNGIEEYIFSFNYELSEHCMYMYWAGQILPHLAGDSVKKIIIELRGKVLSN